MSRPRSPMFERMLGALRLDLGVYEEIEADRKATGEAAFIVVATAFVAAAGQALRARAEADVGIVAGVAAIVGWAFSALVALVVGNALLRGTHTRADWGEVARTIAYANTPRFFLLLVAVPGLSGVVSLVVGLWVMAGTVTAMRAAFDVSLARATAIAIASAFAQVAIVVWLAVEVL